jgi:hypothetical protein
MATPGEGPVILYFRATVEEADPGDTIVLEWDSTGGTRATLYAIPPSGHLPAEGREVAPTGSCTHTISPQERNSSQFLLYVTDQADRGSSAWLVLKLRCPVSWFFSPAPDVCATDPVFSSAAEEYFERGVMIWVEAWDRIIVL